MASCVEESRKSTSTMLHIFHCLKAAIPATVASFLLKSNKEGNNNLSNYISDHVAENWPVPDWLKDTFRAKKMKSKFQISQDGDNNWLIHPPGCRTPCSFWGIAWIVFLIISLVAVYYLFSG